MKTSFLLLITFLIATSGSASVAILSNPLNGNHISLNEPDPAVVKFAFRDLMNLSRKERHERIKEAKIELKNLKRARRSGDNVSTNQVLLIVLAILLPPLAVYLHEGVINNKFWLDLILTLLFFVPGIIYALIVVLAKG